MWIRARRSLAPALQTAVPRRTESPVLSTRCPFFRAPDRPLLTRANARQSPEAGGPSPLHLAHVLLLGIQEQSSPLDATSRDASGCGFLSTPAGALVFPSGLHVRDGRWLSGGPVLRVTSSRSTLRTTARKTFPTRKSNRALSSLKLFDGVIVFRIKFKPSSRVGKVSLEHVWPTSLRCTSSHTSHLNNLLVNP